MSQGTLTVNLTLTPEQIRAALPRCGSCKHWRAQPGSIDDKGRCLLSMDSHWDMASHAEGFTWADAYKHPPYLATRPNFGCTLWEARE